jgi:uncharacterized membrane protein
MTRWLSLSITLTALALFASLYVWMERAELLPEKVPTHWGISGEADRFTPREKMLPHLLIAPGIMLAVVLLSQVLPWLSPKPFTVEGFRPTYDYLMALLVALFGFIGVALLLGYTEWVSNSTSTRLLVAGIFLFFAAIGNVLGKVRRNFWIGVRTPWTLANETVWDRTHRMAAWLFVAAGLLGFVGVLLGAPLLACFVGILIAALAPVLYSLVLYKRLEREGKA